MSSNGEHGLTFEPSAQLKQARELTQMAQASGHPRPMLDYKGLYSFFDALEQEERKVFELQISLGRLAYGLEETKSELRSADAAHQAMQEQIAHYESLLREIVADEPEVQSDEYRYWCFYCDAEGSTPGELEHDADCVITRAKEIVGEQG